MLLKEQFNNFCTKKILSKSLFIQFSYYNRAWSFYASYAALYKERRKYNEIKTILIYMLSCLNTTVTTMKMYTVILHSLIV